jgi:AraC-like DNA-binding protein
MIVERSPTLPGAGSPKAASSEAALARVTREELLRAASRAASGEGATATSIPFLSILRSSKPTRTRHGVLEPSLCFVVQGAKRLEIGGTSHAYGAGSYVASAIDFPTSGQITRATRDEPYLAVRIAFDATEIAAIIVEAGLDLGAAAPRASESVFVSTSDAPMRASLLKLLQLLDEPADAVFLAGAVKREIIYRLLKGEHGPAIYRCVKPRSLGVVKAIGWVKRHFAEPMAIDALAKASRMSVSSLRHAFKATTAMGPLQYQKQLRLQEARRLLLAGEVDASGAAFRVGYESASQFSREYRRLFGAPPVRDVQKMKDELAGAAL